MSNQEVQVSLLEGTITNGKTSVHRRKWKKNKAYQKGKIKERKSEIKTSARKKC